MAGNQLHRQYLTLLEADFLLTIFLLSTASEEEDIVILPPVHGDSYASDVEDDDVDECEKTICFQTMLQKR